MEFILLARCVLHVFLLLLVLMGRFYVSELNLNLQMYPLLERISPGTRKLELFARMHNTHAGYANLTYYIANKNN